MAVHTFKATNPERQEYEVVTGKIFNDFQKSSNLFLLISGITATMISRSQYDDQLETSYYLNVYESDRQYDVNYYLDSNQLEFCPYQITNIRGNNEEHMVIIGSDKKVHVFVYGETGRLIHFSDDEDNPVTEQKYGEVEEE